MMARSSLMCLACDGAGGHREKVPFVAGFGRERSADSFGETMRVNAPTHLVAKSSTSRVKMGRCWSIADIFLCFSLGLFWRDGVTSFNLDTTRPIFYDHQDNQSQFGFAFTLHRVGSDYKLIIGAPRAQSQAFQPQEVDRSGAVYSCPIDVDSTGSPTCEEMVLDNIGSTATTNASRQWLGSTVHSAGSGGPIVVCRPLHKRFGGVGTNREYRYNFGGCYVITEDLLDNSAFEPCRFYYGRSLGFLNIYCEFGFSATVRNNKLVYGAPGSHIWEGAAWYTGSTIDDSSRFSFIPRNHRARYSSEFYLGYSVALGNFKGDSGLEYAISQPRYNNGYGRVLLYDKDGNYYRQLSSSTLGTYFGHAMAVSDLNNDGSEDLIISAPLYTDADRNIAAGWEVGKVTIYYNDKQGGFSDNYGIAIGTQEGCRFGYSLAAVGDINQDGFNDFAVGAPFCGNGLEGKVFIYHGSGINIPIDLTPKQILTPSASQSPLKYFGFSLSAGLDVDGNTYPDLAVGAHGSQSVILYRTRQIVMAVGELSFSHSSVDLDIKNYLTSSGVPVAGFSVEVCIQYEGQGVPSEIEFQIDIQLDVARELAFRRSAFVETSRSSIQRTMQVEIYEQSCAVHDVFVAPTIRDKQTPISISLDYRLVDNGQADASTVPPVLAEEVNTHIVSSIAFARECAGATCFPDLAVMASSDVTQLTIGEAQVINLDVMVTNKGEDAFLSVLRIREPSGLYFVTAGRLSTGAIASCTFHAPSRVRMCDLGNPVGANRSVAFQLRYQTESYSALSGNVSFNVTALSFDEEKPESYRDNEQTTNIPVYATANLTLQGAADLDRLIVRETDYPSDRNLSSEASIGPQIVHVIALNNAGPSGVGLTHLTILWPMRLKSGAYIMTEPDVAMDTEGTCSRGTVEYVPNVTSEEGITATTVDNANDNSTRTILHLSCDGGAECYAFICPIASINTGSSSGRGNVVVTITTTAIADALLNDTSVDAFRITSTTLVRVEGSPYPGITFSHHPIVHPISVDTFVEVEFAETIVVKETTPPYVYIASAIGGFIILAAITIGLYFAGFFKRRKLNSDQRRKLRQSIRQSRLAKKGQKYSPVKDADPADMVESAEEGNSKDIVKSDNGGGPENIADVDIVDDDMT